MKQIFTRKEAADYLCISVVTIDRLSKKGDLKSRKIRSRVVFKLEDLNAYLDTCIFPATNGVTGGKK